LTPAKNADPNPGRYLGEVVAIGFGLTVIDELVELVNESVFPEWRRACGTIFPFNRRW